MASVHWGRLLVAAALVLVLVLTLEAGPAAGASPKACRVTNTGTGRSYERLRDAVRAADPAHTLIVTGRCLGVTEIRIDLVIKGATSRRSGKPILDGARQTRVLTVGRHATVVVKDLTIQHGRARGNAGPGVGGGIANFGTLTLRNVVVRDNHALNDGGGIYNQGVLTLAGRTSIRDNRGAAGISNYEGSWWEPFSMERPSSITMNDASSVSGNDRGAVYLEAGTLTMNDRSSIFGNENGGGVSLWMGRLVMNDTSSIHDNQARAAGGGVSIESFDTDNPSLMMNDASSIHDNRAVASDGTAGRDRKARGLANLARRFLKENSDGTLQQE